MYSEASMIYLIVPAEGEYLARDLLVSSCKRGGVRYLIADPSRFDPTTCEVTSADSCYRIALTPRARLLEEYLIRQGCRSFWRDNFAHMSVIEQIERCLEAGITCIPTIYFPVLDPLELARQVEAVGGYPVIVKVMGSYGGQGIYKADSMSSLLSLLRNAISLASTDVIMEKYIAHSEQARIIVLGGEVIAEKGNLKNSEEIVLNTGLGFDQVKRGYSPEIRGMAIAACRAMGIEFGGVDIILGEDGKNYLAEVNLPCAFQYTQEVTGIDIASKIVEFLK